LSRGAVRHETAAALTFVAIVALAVTLSFLSGGTAPIPACDAQLSRMIGASQTGLCLRPLEIVIPKINTSELVVPVLGVGPGQMGTVEILYRQAGHGSGNPNQASIRARNASQTPIALSVSHDAVNMSAVSFSEGTLVYQNFPWVIYSYNLTASSRSAGYYAILTPYYCGMNPALAVGVGPGDLNATAMSLWGYVGLTECEEYVYPAVIVATTGIEVFNVTVPQTEYCPNAACALISRSGY